MKFGSLFAGIGGIDLGLERAGMECIWQVENDEYCTRVLEKHWPDVTRYGDIRGLTPPPVDLIAGGFPCQPHSVAGKRRGAEDDRNLWPEFIRVIRELKPRYVLAENVPGIITTYIDTVLSDLEGEGYTCPPLNLPAVAFDAPHRRERIFIVAYTLRPVGEPGSGRRGVRQSDSIIAHSSSEELWDQSGWRSGPSGPNPPKPGDDGAAGSVADAKSIRESQCCNHEADREHQEPTGEFRGNSLRERRESFTHWTAEPRIRRVDHGIPSRVDQLRGLGNAVVPQIAEWIGRRILDFDSQ